MNLDLLTGFRHIDLRHHVWIKLLSILLLSSIVLNSSKLCLLIWYLNKRLLNHRLHDLGNLYDVIQVSMVIFHLRLIFSTSPLSINNKLILMTSGIQFDHKIEFSFINSLHRYLLPFSKRSSYM